MIAPTTPNELSEITGALDDTKSVGPCSIPTKCQKIAIDDFSVTFSEICNSSFEKGVFSEKNKSAKVIPSHKKGSAKHVNNYRPISLLSTFSKIMETLMATRLNKFLELHSIIYHNQYGFRAGFSIIHSLISITETIDKTIEAKKYGCGTDSHVKPIICGVPQGSILGHILYLLYINDLPNISDKLIFFLFADDTSIYLESSDLSLLEKIMNKELETLYD